ncbi:serine hydrolase [Rhodococcus triatomae]|uniref:Beta-lactamase class A n=1 Tax=Rhodococcus triatomae TaxID=300028 RepID=A0A1G8PZ81_9NOCA|nr:serine hydrolase [Rhodococcus triatomae]QNG19220.1 serine hydrolase [Rhodococcus triatomae]QNG24867.1 serine hydrolase [Rhodococcus triatomae]SDI97804.1 Beta-lactamase class A [Rhodococcus triatomae]
MFGDAGRRFVGVLVPTLAVICVTASCAVGESPSPPGPQAADTLAIASDLTDRLDAVETWANTRHARVSLVLLDRETGDRVGYHEKDPILTASLAKLFVAAELSHLDATGERGFSTDDGELLARMLSSSDDFAADVLWDELDGPDLVAAVADRYHLDDTHEPWDGMWWNTQTTVTDLATFYDLLLADRDGLGPVRTNRILGYLRAWTPLAADGYDQRFGVPAVLGGSDIAVKQGWMCCIDEQWIHLSTGVVGPGGRYVVVVEVAEDVQYEDGVPGLPDTSYVDATDDESAAHARETVTGVIEALFPTGSVDDWGRP